MNKRTIIIIVLVIAGLFAGGFLFFTNEKDGPSKNTAEAKEVYYCPMHKEYISDNPGNCPICSMKLVKKEGSDQEAMKKMQEQSSGSQTSQMSMDQMQTASAPTGDTGSVFIPPQRQQVLGVRSVPAETKSLSREIRTVGKIAYDETRITHIHTKFNGWVENVFVDFVGQPVKRGQPLFTIYSPELLSTQQEYLLALRSEKQLGNSSFDWIAKSPSSLTESAKARLRLWGVSEGQIDEIAKTGKTTRALTIYSPVSGVVTQRAAYHHGMYVTPELELYTIVDLSTVWLLADIYEKDLPFIKMGQSVRVQFPYAEQPPMNVKVDFFYPYLDPNTRTGQVRIQLRNPNSQFKPDQFVNVVLQTPEKTVLVVPNDAVLNTGDKQYVFVELGSGYFDPRQVQIGIQTKEGTEIATGVKEGERVVTAANFLLDSEARLRGVLENMGKPSKAQTMQVAPSTGGLVIQVLEPKTAKTGDNRMRVSVKDAGGKPVSGAEVEVTLSMPQMGAMPPMSNKAMLLDQGNGIYAGNIEFQMAWTWETTIVVKKENKVIGSMKTTVTAR
ncbi:efflux RND transporter periplasmic adaptor subunit [bacterium]|nr:efflux RND transporter periplasmic adaptor subunit [bacterium]MCI0601561.1 efflux RND transporter periplasmic adaptor subunit [bacterium]